MKLAEVKLLERLEHRAILLFKQPLGNMYSEVRIHANQMCIERGVVDLGKRNPIWHHGLPILFVPIRDDVRGVEELSWPPE